jgi:catechol 2,3-dioxygenase-like lactoylglutathione lyase family enzyme
MKRFHVHVGVSDLDRSVRFYSALFDAAPTVLKHDYAKWMLDDPRVNFAISSDGHGSTGVDHLGIQAQDSGDLHEVRARLERAGRPILEEGATTCCYARSERSRITDPDGVAWETFHTSGEATVYGTGPALSALSENEAKGSCCAPATTEPAEASRCCRGTE